MPPETVTSPFTNVVEGSLSVNVIVAVAPALRAALSLTIATVGAVTSMVKAIALRPGMLVLADPSG